MRKSTDNIITKQNEKHPCSRTILLAYVGNTKGRGLLASTITTVHPRWVETTTEETSKVTVISGATVAATEVKGVATSDAETFPKYKLKISYMTSSKKIAATTATVVMLTTQSLI